jgi:hypothetical protein
MVAFSGRGSLDTICGAHLTLRGLCAGLTGRGQVAKSSDDVAALAAEQLAAINDAVVRDALESLLQIPSRHLRDWDYGVAGEQYECWTVAVDAESDTALVYSEHGFGPVHPWGLVSASERHFGMDSGWFLRLEDAFVGSPLGARLPVWNVVAEGGAGADRTLATSLTMAEAFRKRDAVAALDTGGRYHVVYRSLPPEGIP